ncbi:hypothetical protein HGM15179_018441, partial [Zosterops borbonicus]
LEITQLEEQKVDEAIQPRLEITQLEEQKVDEAIQPSSRFQMSVRIPASIQVLEMSGVDPVVGTLLGSASFFTIGRDAALPVRLFDP